MHLLKLSWRNLVRNKSFSIINITGLAIGIASALLLFIVVRYELSYDVFQKEYKRIYRVATKDKFEDGISYNPGIPIPALEALRVKFPQIKFGGIQSTNGSQVTVSSGNGTDNKFIEKSGIFFCDPVLISIFQPTWVTGNAEILKDPYTVVLSKAVAEKYFGDAQQAMGKTLKLDNNIVLKVSGIIENPASNTDFPFHVLISMETVKKNPALYNYNEEWGSTSSSYQVYALLPSNVAPSFIDQQLIPFANEHYHKSEGAAEAGKSNFLQPLSQIHFDTRLEHFGDHRTSKTIIWTLSLIAAFILLMACINFINLSTAQAVTRSKEVGIRKVLGSNRLKLFWQIIGETGMLVFISLTLAILIAWLSVPFVKYVISMEENIHLFSITNIILAVCIGIVVTFLAGIYPALTMSGFSPITALKSKIIAVSTGGISLRRSLVVLQFSISQILIIGTIVAVSQMDFVRNSDLGFNKDAVYMINISGDSVSINRQLPFGEDLKKIPGVRMLSFASDPPASDNNWSSNFAFNHKPDEKFQVFMKFADTGYVNTFGLHLVAGKNYEPSDTTREGLVNETMMHLLGIQDPTEMVGKDIRIGGGNWYKIAGVVKDFKANSLKTAMKPIFIGPYKPVYYKASVKVHSNNLAATKAEIEKVYTRYFPEYAYAATFLDESINELYKQDEQMTLLYKIFAGLAIFIACLGLYGLVSFMAVQKTKEVGIRKVLGASVRSIIYMFSKEFTVLILISFLIAFPVAWYFMRNWLNDFHYRITLHAGFFILAVAISVFIAWIAVGYKAIRAALSNPVKALRTE
ncbi:MAG: ABC transporter permease [Agriterribacter sp.]